MKDTLAGSSKRMGMLVLVPLAVGLYVMGLELSSDDETGLSGSQSSGRDG